MVGALVAAAISFAWCLLAARLGPRLGMVDVPDGSELKAHRVPAVPLGGVGVFLGVHVALAAIGRVDPGLLAATAIVLLLGLADDRLGLTPGLRLAVEGVAGVVLVAFSDVPWESAAELLVGVLLVVVVINAVNLFDGLDGLVGASGAVSALGLAALAAGRGADGALGVVLAAALGGFLVVNWHPARVFLGDNGSYTVGALFAYAVLVASPDALGVGFGIALLGLGVFALDLVATVVRRRLAGRPLFAGDRSHLYDQLHDRGLSVPAVALWMAATQTAFSAAALGLDAADLGAWSWLVIAVAVVALAAGLAAAGFLRQEPL